MPLRRTELNVLEGVALAAAELLQTPFLAAAEYATSAATALRGIQNRVVSKNTKYNDFGFGGIKRPF